jgi:hypothetical protein
MTRSRRGKAVFEAKHAFKHRRRKGLGLFAGHNGFLLGKRAETRSGKALESACGIGWVDEGGGNRGGCLPRLGRDSKGWQPHATRGEPVNIPRLDDGEHPGRHRGSAAFGEWAIIARSK